MPDRDEKKSVGGNSRNANELLSMRNQVSASGQMRAEKQASRREQGTKGQDNQGKEAGDKADKKEDKTPNKSLRQRIVEKSKKSKKGTDKGLSEQKKEDEGMSDMIFIAVMFFAVIKDVVADPLSLMLKATALGIPLALLFDWLIIPAAITIPLYVILFLGGSNGVEKQLARKLIPYALVLVVEFIPIVKFIPATILLVLFLKITSSPMFKKVIEKVPVAKEAIEKIV